MSCPKCESDKMTIINPTFPKTIECDACGHVFLESRKVLIDE